MSEAFVVRVLMDLEMQGERVPTLWAVVTDDSEAAIRAVQDAVPSGFDVDEAVGKLSVDTVKSLQLYPGKPRRL